MTPLQEKTYELLKKVPKGHITTYKDLAMAVGTRAYRAIGQSMKNNPYAYESCTDKKKRIPCHRVIASDGAIGGFNGKTQGKAIAQKIALLESEGIVIQKAKIVNFINLLFVFN